MFHFIVFKKATGEISRVISRPAVTNFSLANLGYNIFLYGSINVVSQLTRINPNEWKIENDILVKSVVGLPSLATVGEQQPENLKLVFVGDKPTDKTGFGTQYELLAAGLKQRRYNITFISFQEAERLIDIECDYVIALSDYGSVKKMFDLGLNNWIFWFALESKDWPSDWNKSLSKVPHIVPVTRFGQAALKNNNIHCEDYIPHGVSPDVMRPVPLRQRAVLRREAKVDSNFVISYIGTNVERKHLDLLLESYAKFVSKHDPKRTSLLLLKTKTRGAYDLPQLIKQYGAEYNIAAFDAMVRVINKELENEHINEFINISDLGFSASSGEGFCIPIIEYLMCGVPFLMGNHTAATELLLEQVPLVNIKSQENDSKYRWTRYLIDTDHACTLLGEYFNRWKNNTLYDRQKLREYATRYSVQRMVNAWDLYLQELDQKKALTQFESKTSAILQSIVAEEADNISNEKAEQAIKQVPQTNEAVKWIRVTP